MSKLERDYQAGLIRRLKSAFPGSIVLKNDTSYLQGAPDLTVFYNDRWAFVEVKKSESEPYQPNQEYYLERANEMSVGVTICPENEEEAIRALQSAFKPRRISRFSQR